MFSNLDGSHELLMSETASGDRASRCQLELHQGTDEHGVVLQLDGELDLASAPRLELALREIGATNPGRILLDLRGLGFMDSSGISVIMQAQRAAEVHGHQLALRRGPNQVQRLFRLTGILDRLTFQD